MKPPLKWLAAALLLTSSLAATAEPQRIATDDEQNAIRMAKRISHGGRIVSTDKDWFNWDVNILSGCTYYRVEVSHSTGQVSGFKKEKLCGNPEALRELRAKAAEFQRTTNY